MMPTTVNGKFRSEKHTWAFDSGELKTKAIEKLPIFGQLTENGGKSVCDTVHILCLIINFLFKPSHNNNKHARTSQHQICGFFQILFISFFLVYTDKNREKIPIQKAEVFEHYVTARKQYLTRQWGRRAGRFTVSVKPVSSPFGIGQELL